MAYFSEGEEIGFGRRGCGPRGGGFGGGRPMTVEIEEPVGDEVYLGVSVDGDYDIFGQEVDIIQAEVDSTGAPRGRGRRIGNRIKKVLRRRENAQNRWENRDRHLLAEQRALETRAGVPHTPASFEHARPAAGCGGPPANRALSKPLATSASVANAASTTLTLTPQYRIEVDKFVMSASLTLPAVLITNLLFGVDPLYGNPEATSGWSADAFATNGTMGDFVKGKILVPQTPVKISITNGHTATQTISAFIKSNTSLGEYAATAA